MPEKRKVSLQSKTFVILFALALVGTYLCLVFSQKMVSHGGLFSGFFSFNYLARQAAENKQISTTTVAAEYEAVVDTKTWKTLSNTKYGFTLLYPPTWSIKNLGVQGDYYILEVRPTAKSNPITIHINHQNFRAMDGLMSKTEKLNSDDLINVNGELYGLQHDAVHMTFDLSTNLSYKKEFQAMVHSVVFK